MWGPYLKFTDLSKRPLNVFKTFLILHNSLELFTALLSYLGAHNQYFILHGVLLWTEAHFDWKRKKGEGECVTADRLVLEHGVYGLKDQFGKVLVSNLSCTNDTEAVLASSEIIQVYLEKTTDILYDYRREINKYFLAPEEGGSVEVVENSVSYDQKMYWLKGKPRKDGFFTLTHPKSGKLLTYGTPGYPGFIIKGDCQISLAK